MSGPFEQFRCTVYQRSKCARIYLSHHKTTLARLSYSNRASIAVAQTIFLPVGIAEVAA